MSRAFKLALASLVALALFATGCGGDDGDDTKAAFVMVAPIGDAGWNFMHDQGRLGAQEDTGVETAFVDSIPEDRKRSQRRNGNGQPQERGD